MTFELNSYATRPGYNSYISINHINKNHAEDIRNLFNDSSERFVSKVEFKHELCNSGYSRFDSSSISKSLFQTHSQRITTKELVFKIDQLVANSHWFESQNCKGFSFYVDEQPKITLLALRDQFNFNLALLPSADFFYPERIRRFLRRRSHHNHYRVDGFPSIAFALGQIVDDSCFISVLQSDIAYRTPSFFRGYFRSWRKLLLMSLVESALLRNCRYINLIRAEDAVRCCRPHSRPNIAPASWLKLYDGTALEFGLELREITGLPNVQFESELPDVRVKFMYVGKLAELRSKLQSYRLTRCNLWRQP